MKLAIVGATGMVGQTMLEVLKERKVSIEKLYLVASEVNKGKALKFDGEEYFLTTLEEVINEDIDYALFSAGGEVSTEWAPKFAHKGATVIDNSSAWRMDENCPLVVPQINLETIGENKIIANPNCSTIQMVVVLKPLHEHFGIKRVIVSTYQSVSGAGKSSMDLVVLDTSDAGLYSCM